MGSFSRIAKIASIFPNIVSSGTGMGLGTERLILRSGLYINVVKPSSAANDSALPVAVVSTTSLCMVQS